MWACAAFMEASYFLVPLAQAVIMSISKGCCQLEDVCVGVCTSMSVFMEKFLQLKQTTNNLFYFSYFLYL